MHGAGTVQAIEEKEVLGKKKNYYILNIPHINMRIMIPMDNAATLGIRQVVELDILDHILEFFHHGNTDPNIYENQIFCRNINKKKIMSGDIYQGTEIIRDLVRKSKKNKLGAEDIKMLNSARQIFISELAQVKNIPQDQANILLDEILSVSFEEAVSSIN